MLPIWRTVPSLAVFALLGVALDRLLSLDLGRGLGRWARWATCGIVATFALALHPFVLCAGAGPAAGGPVTPRPPRPWRGTPWWGIAAALLGFIVVCRPATLAYWDSFVWLAKARIE